MKRPNILFIIADDQSWPHASAYGCKFVKTPAFDRIASEGILFTNAFCCAPQCSPARASALTGLNMWRLEEGSLLASILPAKFKVYPDILEEHGYHVGYTGKGWGPGEVEGSGRKRNPAGPAYNDIRLKPPTTGIKDVDYFENFKAFISHRQDGQPFCFWVGSHEPHRKYEKGSGLRAGMKLKDVEVPPYLPDTEEVRSDLLDYALEIQWYDSHVYKMLDFLEATGEMDHTLIISTADNGMPFPRSKANLYINSCQVPFTLCWKARTPGGRVVTDFVSFVDLMPTFLEAAGIEPDRDLSGLSLIPIIDSNGSGRIDASRSRVFCGRERHIHCRPDTVGYPSRSIRTDDYLYIVNYAYDRWPVGDPVSNFGDTDNSPTKSYMIEHKDEAHVRDKFDLAFSKRPAMELYDLRIDPHCLRNIADQPEYADIGKTLHMEMETFLISEKDPRVLGYGDIFDSYPYFQGPWPWHDQLPGFKDIGKYNLEARRRAEKQMYRRRTK